MPDSAPTSPQAPPDHNAQGCVTLAPRPWVALGTMALGALGSWAGLADPAGWAEAGGVGFHWIGLAVVAFGGFLLLQTFLLRLRFDDDALLVLRGGKEIRRFPYQAWLGWKLFLPALPVLFYFREERSIHLLPVLFDATTLRDQLVQRLGQKVPPPTR